MRQRENQPTVRNGSRDHEYGQESETTETPFDKVLAEYLFKRQKLN